MERDLHNTVFQRDSEPLKLSEILDKHFKYFFKNETKIDTKLRYEACCRNKME